MSRNFYISLLALLLSGGYLQAQEQPATNAFSLEECVEYALNHQADVKNAELSVKIAEARVREISGLGFPQISAEGNLMVNPVIPQTIPSSALGGMGAGGADQPATGEEQAGPNINELFNPKYKSDVNVTANQLIFDGTFFLGLKAAQVYKDLASKQLTQSKVERVAAVASAYYTVLVTQENLKILEQNYTTIEKLYTETKAMYEAGMVEQIEQDRIEVTFNNIKVQKERVEQMFVVTKNLLKLQIGMDQEDELTLSEDLYQLGDKIVSSDNNEVNRRIELDILDTQYRLNDMERKSHMLGYAPKVFAFASAGYQGFGRNPMTFEADFSEFSNSDNWFGFAVVGATIKWTPFDGLMMYRKAQQSKLASLQIENSRALLNQSIEVERSQYQIAYETNLKTLRIQRKNMEVAKRVYDIAQVKFKEGVGSSLEVTNAEQAYTQASNSYFAAIYDALTAKVNLDKANGVLYTE
ncbi:TolC family protein [Algivirga pacifica]|uniref:TolC family protein n=1 Tax=Algivirga pacifica TaxID=1162670 RepID=A0ABP9D5U8_9BACT